MAQNDVTKLEYDGEAAGGSPAVVLETVAEELRQSDPDVLILSTGILVPLVQGQADELDIDLQLGRQPGYTCLASKSTYQSYGRIGHLPARYDAPGRAIVDRSNSSLMGSGGIPGMVDLVERSHKPLQEVSWGSIGNILHRHPNSRGTPA